jgi:hypothetical protein
MDDLPAGHIALECAIGGVIYRGSYTVDESANEIHVFSEFGHNSTRGLCNAPQHQRDRANRGIAEWLFKAMIQGWLAC